MNLIEVRDLSFSYGNDSHALSNVSFDIEAGKYISIIGHNGSGKSTIAKLLIGLLEPKENTIKEFGEYLWKKQKILLGMNISLAWRF